MDKYEKLEGKRVKYWCSDSKFIWAIVVNIDPDVGITIVHEDDRTNNCLCYSGPLSPLWEEYFSEENYRKDFQSVYEQIKKGEIDVLEDDDHCRAHDGSVPQEFCSFNQ